MWLLILLNTFYVLPGNGQTNKPSMDEKETKYLKMIKPNQKVFDGIQNGNLILYGQWIAQPYNIEIKHQKLYINGVQASPPITPPWLKMNNAEVKDENRKISLLTNQIRTIHRQFKNDENHQKRIDKFLKKNNITKSYKWLNNSELFIETIYDIEFTMLLGNELEINEEELRTNLLEQSKKEFEASLTKGSLLVIGYGPVLTIPDIYLEEHLFVLKNNEKNKKREYLKKVLYDEQLIREFLFINEKK